MNKTDTRKLARKIKKYADSIPLVTYLHKRTHYKIHISPTEAKGSEKFVKEAYNNLFHREIFTKNFTIESFFLSDFRPILCKNRHKIDIKLEKIKFIEIKEWDRDMMIHLQEMKNKFKRVTGTYNYNKYLKR